MDRPLPFLCVYRCPPDQPVAGADSLVLSQASHLSVSGEPELAEAVSRLVAEIGCLSDRYGAFLVLELWADPATSSFRIHAPPTEPASTVAALAESLKHVDVLGNPAEVETVPDPAPGPPGRPPLLSPDEQRRHGVLLLGLEVPGFFLDQEARPYPGVLRRLQHDLASAVRRAVFEFTTVQTSFRPEDFRALGPRRLLKATRHADRRLAEIADQIDLLLAVTPVNADDAWAVFRDAGFRQEPTFHYRPLAVDPDLLKRALYAVPLERVEDPTLVGIFRAQRQALDRQVTMLEDRGSDAFLPASLQLYGGTDDALFELAETILARLRTGNTDGGGDCESAPAPCLDAHAFAARAREELRHYEEVAPHLSEAVEVRDDVPGVLVAQGRLLVGAGVQIPEARADALVQHEVGTHIVTLVNGHAQPLRLLHVGLAGYEETQEGLAVLAEYVTGGLTAGRLTTLAARVVAVHHLIAGAPFTETFHQLHEGHGLPPRLAFRVTMRVYRSGGLTKDAIYLRGLDRVLRHLAEGQPIDPLLVGKIPLDYVPVIQELQWRGVIAPPRLQPRWLTAAASAERLAAVRNGLGVLDLLPKAGT
jgi:uncharacterized protein (TIGR02421 family)